MTKSHNKSNTLLRDDVFMPNTHTVDSERNTILTQGGAKQSTKFGGAEYTHAHTCTHTDTHKQTRECDMRAHTHACSHTHTPHTDTDTDTDTHTHTPHTHTQAHTHILYLRFIFCPQKDNYFSHKSGYLMGLSPPYSPANLPSSLTFPLPMGECRQRTTKKYLDISLCT